ncbi:MAG: undecaprenyldiphospho-muramoylpentapeptide beta-N-acetylglucosaminyltransferase [Bacteroidetes bacterium 4484_276]|nr:MAG: undecaprenyldiphospho-muramoylpentapeptide beta-N-acetylglucosaminyltransferase [Bacteroidetes bacterium 4484_276]
MPQHEHKILISGGGTGGHIFPAIAIADALQKKLPTADILFVGAKGRMEMEKVPLAGYPIEGLWISGFQRRLTFRNLLFPFKLIFSLLKAGWIIKKFKPDVVIGVGGYASGPIGQMAARKGIPLVLQEQNSFPGITNKLLAKKASKICVAYEGMDKYFAKEKLCLAGNPVRQNVIDIEDKKKFAYEYFELDKNKPVVLIVGGSQGAMSINESVSKNLELLVMNNLQLIWQTGKLYTEKARKDILEKLNGNNKGMVKVMGFINKMDFAYAVADIVVSRAGAIAISELCAVGKPTILIPLPTAAEGHQEKNALALVDKDAAIHLKDSDAPGQFAKIVTNLAKDPERMKQLSINIKKMSISGSAEKIADVAMKLC